MTIAVAMTTYNGEKYVEEQLNSFLNQSILPNHIVICDDKSNDNTLKILNDFKEKAPFKVDIYLNEKNLGYTKNFEKAISLCNADIIFLSDQDDCFFEKKFEENCTIFLNNKSVFFTINDAIITDALLNPTSFTKLNQNRTLGYSDNNFKTGCCSAFRKEIVNIILPIPDVIAHDIWINRFGDLFNNRFLIEKPLQYYRRHDKNSSQDITSSKKKLGFFAKFFFYGIKNNNQSLEKNILIQEHFIKRIQEKEELIKEYFPTINISEILNKLQSQKNYNHKRLLLLKKNRIFRFFGLVSFYFFQNKTHKNWKRFLKDAIRP